MSGGDSVVVSMVHRQNQISECQLPGVGVVDWRTEL